MTTCSIYDTSHQQSSFPSTKRSSQAQLYIIQSIVRTPLPWTISIVNLGVVIHLQHTAMHMQSLYLYIGYLQEASRAHQERIRSRSVPTPTQRSHTTKHHCQCGEYLIQTSHRSEAHCFPYHQQHPWLAALEGGDFASSGVKNYLYLFPTKACPSIIIAKKMIEDASSLIDPCCLSHSLRHSHSCIATRAHRFDIHDMVEGEANDYKNRGTNMKTTCCKRQNDDV